MLGHYKGLQIGAQQGITLRLTDVMVNELADKAERPIDFEQGSGGFTLKQYEDVGIEAPVNQEKVLFGDMEAEVSTESKNEFEDEIPF